MGGGEAEGGKQQEARAHAGRSRAPPSLCTPSLAPLPAPACYLLYKYFLNYQRILVSTFCAWLVSRSEGDRDRMESPTENETKKRGRGRRRDGETVTERARDEAGQTDGERKQNQSQWPRSRVERKPRAMRVGRSGTRVSAPGKERGGRGWGGQAGFVTREKSGLCRGGGCQTLCE